MDNANVLQRDFVYRPDPSSNDFFTKLRNQLADSGAAAQQFAAELLWALLLFPSNIGADLKREHVKHVWSWSNESLPNAGSWLDANVLNGAGSCNTLRWKEMGYLIALLCSLKALPQEQRRAVFTDYDYFIDWIDSVQRDSKRQFRHMLRWFAFPDRVERMSSMR